MSQTYICISTMARCRFRRVPDIRSPHLHTGGQPASEGLARDELLAGNRQQEQLARFLAEMDRKLDAVLSLLQSESLAREFPCEGHVVELGGDRLRFECALELAPGQALELLVMLDAYPMRIVSIIGRVAQGGAAVALPELHARTYPFSFDSISEEDRDAVIRSVFNEEITRIRQAKGTG